MRSLVLTYLCLFILGLAVVQAASDLQALLTETGPVEEFSLLSLNSRIGSTNETWVVNLYAVCAKLHI